MTPLRLFRLNASVVGSLAFLAVGAQTLCLIASDTLFVSAFDIGRLSGFYIVTALLRTGLPSKIS